MCTCTARICPIRVGARPVHVHVDDYSPSPLRGSPVRPARRPARLGPGRGPPVPGTAVRGPDSTPVPAPDLDGPAGLAVLLEPVIDPPAAHAARGLQLRDRDPLRAGVVQRVPQRRVGPGVVIT